MIVLEELTLLMGTHPTQIRDLSYTTAKGLKLGPTTIGTGPRNFFGTQLRRGYRTKFMQFGRTFPFKFYLEYLTPNRLCVEAPREGARLRQIGDEKLLSLAQECEV